ncbi:MAG: PQQ-dependent sugar dehydrogenase [Gemmataceae bacterium]|nr:PQQ-dependent sugar dehydrogenase [Gemmata sp.]MDW8198298.1 PQQ-dependent sugar dehydrogenase [Gemmataceae bacterium]
MPRFAVAAMLVFSIVCAVALIYVISSTPDGSPAANAQQEEDEASTMPTPEEALSLVKLTDPRMRVELWAAEPLLANPVSFCFDEKGRVYIAETTRFGNGVPDTRHHMQWLEEDLANRSIDDLLAMYKKHRYTGFEKFDDQIRLVWDSNGDGKADKSVVFAKGFNRPQDGLAAGVLARQGRVYFTCIPDLYELQDTTGDNHADVRKSLASGFGPTVQYLGHDLHGLRFGFDGKLYFTMGDRGFVVTTKEGQKLEYPNTGAVLRCDPDGRHLEVVHSGLRNPQEIAFDDYGNLFTFDNDSDSGDRARWVYVVEGGESGWHGGFQYGTDYHTPEVRQGNRGAWNVERMWEPHRPEQPAFIVPPLANFGNGPAGITYYPGIGLSDKYKNHFFCCDFTSSNVSSKIWMLTVTPQGASFTVNKPEVFISGLVPSDCEFGPDGAFYWSDWTGGWAPPNKGRIFRVTDPEGMKNPLVAQARQLLAEGFATKTAEELEKLLEFPHQQIRREAQFELASPQRRADGSFRRVLRESKNSLARLHAVWGLGMLARRKRDAAGALLEVAQNPREDVEVRRVAVEQLGQVIRYGRKDDAMDPSAQEVQEALRPLFNDPNDRIKAAAAVAFGKIGQPPSPVRAAGERTYFTPYFDLLKANDDKDPYLRHAAVMGLYYVVRQPADVLRVWKEAAAQEPARYDVPAVRLGVLLTLRKHKSPLCAEFLRDREQRIVAEAARAIYDLRLGTEAMEALAQLADQPQQPDAIRYRALAANYHLGTPAAARRVASFATRTNEADYVRAFALKLLGQWPQPPRRDPITGLTLDLAPRDRQVPVAALTQAGVAIFSGSEGVRKQAAQTVAKLNIQEFAATMGQLVQDAQNPVAVRIEALYAAEALQSDRLKQLAEAALKSSEPPLRAAARAVLARLDLDAVLPQLRTLLKDDTVPLVERQAGFEILARARASAEADKLLAEWLDAANAGQVPAALVLDVLEAAEKRLQSPQLKLFSPIKQKLQAFRNAQTQRANAPGGDPLALYSETLEGGDTQRGRTIFLNNTAVYCQRCHQLDGQGGQVGPPLNGIAADPQKDRRYLLESIVLPSAKIARGYDTVILLLADESTVSGIIQSEDAQRIKLITPENKEVVVAVSDVVRRRTGPSAMPEDLHKKLSRRELRDLVEFLASLKEPLTK